MNEEKYESVGVVLACQGNHKYKAVRIGVAEGGEVIVLNEITYGRALSRALDCAAHDLELLATDISRGKVHLSEPKQLKLKFE